eukprot:GEMP01016957.1.p1 GENE.GEMP01016957.1~~GEMP01016957.1.p1  ORF type:complete len:597 (-),score=128.80 GEMP01016957.1:1006-2796(-)
MSKPGKHFQPHLVDGPSRLEEQVLWQRPFYSAVGQCARNIHSAMKVLTSEQEKIQRTVAKFAGLSDGSMDDYCVYLFGQSGETTQKMQDKWAQYEPVFRSIFGMCDQHVDDINDIADSLRKRNDSFIERRHYEEKVRSLSPGARRERNKKKLDVATEGLSFTQAVSQQKVRIAIKNHPKLLRLTALRLSESVMRILQQWGAGASGWDPGFKVGSEVTQIGAGTKTFTVTGLGPSNARVNDQIIPSVLLTPTTWELPKEEELPLSSEPTETPVEGSSRLTVEEVVEQQETTFEAETSETSHPQKFTVTPRKIRRGKETQLTITCPPLIGPIAEVRIDGQRMEVVSGMRDQVIVSGVLNEVTRGYVEVMTEEAKNTFAAGEVNLVLYEPDRFLSSPVGTNVKLSEGEKVAHRIDGSVNGISFLTITKPFFEIEIDEVMRKTQTRGPAFGFMSPKYINVGRLPNVASELKHALIVGGDLPQMYLNAEKIPNKIAWRPRNELSEGDRIQVLLTHSAFKIFLNGTEKISVNLPSVWWLYEPLVGVIDLAGTLRGVTIIDGADALAHPLFGDKRVADDGALCDDTDSEAEAEDTEVAKEEKE